MKQQPKLQWLIGLFALFVLLVTPVKAVEKQQIALQPPSLEGDTLGLEWWVEGLRGQAVTGAELLVNGAVLAIQPVLEPARGQAVCYMLMVDTSKSMVAKDKNGTVTVDGLKGLLKAFVEGKPAQHALGLMTFGTQAQMLVTPVKDTASLLTAVNSIKFDQARTELFRFVENGVKEMEQCPTNYRRVLLLVSDGVAEDKAFNADAAVRFARQHNTSVYGFIIKNSGSLQNAVYLAEETGGWGAEPAEQELQNRAKTITSLYTDSNTGGNLVATLPIAQPTQGVQLRLTLSDGKNLTVDVPLKLDPAAPQLPSWKKTLLEWFPWLNAAQLDSVLWGLGLLLLLLLGWFAYRASRPHAVPPEAPRDPVGFLVRHGQSYPIYPGINSLGFLPTNDIVIDDDTVGRAHATLHYQGDGDVVLTDLNSLNGSGVNGNRVQRPTSIHDGDNISLGEWQALYQRAG